MLYQTDAYGTPSPLVSWPMIGVICDPINTKKAMTTIATRNRNSNATPSP